MKYWRGIYLLFLVAVLPACGGGSSTTADGGISGSGVSIGAVQGFGSLVIK